MFQAGQQFGNYTLMRQLGRGGFGEVWLAERRTRFLTTQVAVKLPLNEQVDRAAIEQEAQLWAQASGHANILPIIEADEYEGQILIVSEYAVDGSLQGLLDGNGGALSVEQAIEMTAGLLKGLEFLHARQIIHRDIKPANILLQGDTPRLADFGISRVLKTISLATSAVGTPYYMAPEAFKGKRNAQTDVWSVGVMLYQMLKGELPFAGNNITDLFGAIMMSEPAPLPATVPIALQQIVRKALSKNIAGRYQTAREMRDELANCRQRFALPVAAPVHEPPVVKTTDKQTEPPVVKIWDEQTTIKNSVPLPVPIGKPDEIKKMTTRQAVRSVSPLASQVVKANTKRLHFAISIVIFPLLAVIGPGYWLIYIRPSAPTAVSRMFTFVPSGHAEVWLIPFRKGDKFGFSDAIKKLVIPLKYDNAQAFNEGLALVGLNGKYGYIDKAGREVIPLKYDEAYSFSEGLVRVKLNSKYGYIDKAGQEVIPLKYDRAFGFSDGLASVGLNGKYGYIDKAGQEVIPLKYDSASGFSDGLASVGLNGKWGIINKAGREVIPFKYDEAYSFSEGLALVKLNGKYGYIDKAGQETIPPKYGDAFRFSDGQALVELNGKWGIINKAGQEVIPLKYDSAFGFSDGQALVKLNGKYGYIDKAGQEVIPLKYDRAFGFSDGLASVGLNGKYGYIDKAGQEVIPLKYDSASGFSSGLARVTLNNKWFFIDENGTEYYEP